MSTISERIVAQRRPFKDRSGRGTTPELYPGFFEAVRVRLRNSRSAAQLARTSRPQPEEPWDPTLG